MSRACLVSVVAVMVCPSLVCAQNLTVQQPSLSTFSVSTTVMAPDSGGAYLGGVSRAAMGRASHGPLRSGLGLESSAGGLSVHATIHDMSEMDRRILASVRPADDAAADMSPSARHAWTVLKVRQEQPSGTGVATCPGIGTTIAKSNLSLEQGHANLEKGRAAIAKGKVELAKVYFRMADKSGVPEAKAELALANRQSPRTAAR